MAEKPLTAAQILKDFQYAYDWKRPLCSTMKDDFCFALGKQWPDEDVAKLKSKGIKALTINKIGPMVRLLTGIESQNRSDFKAYPEGLEDSIVSEIATALLKNVMKTSDGAYKVSEAFKDGNTGGECYIEPYLDHTKNILFGELKFKKQDYNKVFPDPNHKEYDLSDARYVDKITYSILEDEMVSLFPKKEKEIRRLSSGKIALSHADHERDQNGAELQTKGYGDAKPWGPEGESEAKLYDLLEHYYKKYVPVYYVADMKLGTLTEAASKKEAENYQQIFMEKNAEYAEGDVKIIRRLMPEIWCASMTGQDLILSDERAWFYPRFQSYHLIPYRCYWSTTPLDRSDIDLSLQGVVREVKDLNMEINKRRSQRLRLLNSAANSGWLIQEDTWVNEDEVREFGSTPGVSLKYKTGKPKPERLTPVPESFGHKDLENDAYQDMKDSSGLNTDLLAAQEGGQASGRAIALRQKQGLVMVQPIFDNLSRTKRMLGKFILSQLTEIFDVDRAVRVLGDSFLKRHFLQPVLVDGLDPVTGQRGKIPQLGPDGQLVQNVNQEAVVKTFNKVLNDTSLGVYDVAIGENVSAETIQMANFDSLMDMAQRGLPIPPDVLIEESTIPAGSKEKILAAIRTAEAAAAQVQPTGGQENGKTQKS